ncbi:MAG: 3-hydroxybutyryl-CoA dehydratase [Actinomycetia bacterium]|nr:3-hydroxybutyryl-CoA dehydratase [Actinomycetes bacterium]
MTTWSLDRRGTVALATFTRPPHNLMSMAAMSELEALVEAIATDDGISVMVLTGGVPGYFVAHADLDDLMRLGRGEPVDGDPGSWGRTFSRLATMPQPVVAAVNGQAWGGGCELALACTMRVAAASAHFSQPEVTVGIIPGAGGTQRLPRVVGPGRAAEMVLSGRAVGAEEALRIALVEAVLPDDRFVEHVLDWVRPITEKPRHAVAAAKRALVEGTDMPLADGLRLEGRLFIECQARADTIELQSRFRDGIPPM